MYYTSPHSVTGKTPTELCYGRTIRSKIPSLKDLETAPSRSEVIDRDQQSKKKGEESENIKRGAKDSDLKVGDTVLMKNLVPANKLTPNFSPSECLVLGKDGSRVTVQDKESHKTYQRNVVHLKKVIPQTGDSIDTNSSILQDSVPEQLPVAIPVDNEHVRSSESCRVRRQVKQPTKFKDYVIGDVTSE